MLVGLQTGKVIRSVTSRKAFFFYLWKFGAKSPPPLCAFEIPNCITSHAFRVPVPETPPLP